MKLKIFGALTAVLGLTSCMQMEPPTKVDFLTQVKPLLESRCLECHQHQYVCAGLNLETKKLAMKGGRGGDRAGCAEAKPAVQSAAAGT